MSERNKHLFQFTAAEIASAASAEAQYHDDRLQFWTTILDAATTVVEKTASVKVERLAHTGGWRPQVVVNYGDPGSYQRMEEAARKIQLHTTERDRFQSDAKLYETQGSISYQLDAEDVSHFRFNGRPRDE